MAAEALYSVDAELIWPDCLVSLQQAHDHGMLLIAEDEPNTPSRLDQLIVMSLSDQSDVPTQHTEIVDASWHTAAIKSVLK